MNEDQEKLLEFVRGLPASRADRRARYRQLHLSKRTQRSVEAHVRAYRIILAAQHPSPEGPL